jgi:hypothetical protein
MEFKKTYTKEEVEELIAWFKQHPEMIRDTIQIDAATFYPDFKKTLELYYAIAANLYGKPCYGGQVYHLFKMRERVIELFEQNKQ